MPFKERDVRKMIAEVEATSWHLRECIRVRELTAAHRLERIRRLWMLEEQEVWKREAGFDRIKIIAEMDAQRFRTGFDSEPLYTKLYNPKWPHSPEEHKLDMSIEIGRLRLEILLLQPAPSPHDDYRRNGRLRSVKGWMKPERRMLRLSQRRGKHFFFFKPVSMAAQVRSRSGLLLIYFKQTSG